MAGFLFAGLGLGALCALWGILQRWLARMDPAAPGVEGRCGGCGVVCEDEEAVR